MNSRKESDEIEISDYLLKDFGYKFRNSFIKKKIKINRKKKKTNFGNELDFTTIKVKKYRKATEKEVKECKIKQMFKK